jgi:hypothetical protein
VYAFCSVSVLNVFHLDQFVTWLRDRDDFDHLELVVNLVHSPRHFNVQVLPPALKDLVEERLTTRVLHDRTMPSRLVEPVRELLGFLRHQRPDDAESWRRCGEEITRRDHLRSEDFSTVFPEYAEAVRSVGGW